MAISPGLVTIRHVWWSLNVLLFFAAMYGCIVSIRVEWMSGMCIVHGEMNAHSMSACFFWKCHTMDYLGNLALKIYCSFRLGVKLCVGFNVRLKD
jgi:hypothetical protein